MTQIAIIGAGLAGLTLARELAQHAAVTVFEKSRGVGGRMATRYANEFEFDHGAQFFTARSAAFRDYLRPLLAAGAVAAWRARFVELVGSEQTASRQWTDHYPHYVGTPRMNSVGRFLAEDVDVRLETAVARLRRSSGAWELEDATGEALGKFDWVVSTAPPLQTAALLPSNGPLGRVIGERQMSACFALMLGFATPLELEWDAARVRDADISWISVNSCKPGRQRASTLVVHSTNAWADQHLEDDPEQVLQHLLAETAAVTRRDAASASFVRLHRWRFANIARQQGSSSFVDADARLAACGDWFLRGRVEAAFRSAQHLAAALRGRLQ